MTYTLSNLTYELAVELAIVSEGSATGGSATTIIDTKDRNEEEHYWREGTAWILEDSAGAGAAPEGEYSIISAFDSSTQTVTLRTTLSTLVASGDKYGVAHNQFPLSILVQCVNRAIRDLGTIPITNTTAITTAANQTEYNLPGAANLDLRQVWMQTNTTDADDNRWVLLPRGLYDIEITATGTADKLIFATQPEYPYALKLVYMDNHPYLRDYNDKLSESVHWERVIYRSALHAWNWYRTKTKDRAIDITDNIQYYQALAERADQRFKIPVPTKKAKILWVGNGVEIEPPIGTVRAS